MDSMAAIDYIDIAANDKDLTGGYYNQIIKSIRNRLAADWIPSKLVPSRPILTQYNKTTVGIKWYDIRVRLGAQSLVTLRLRGDDLYVTGYSVNNGTWYEFKEESKKTPLIPNAKFLTYDGSYTTLMRRARVPPTLGGKSIIDAGTNLVKGEDEAGSLLTMILMFCEAVRFVPIELYVLRTFDENMGVPAWLKEDLVKNWGKYSGYVLYYHQNPSKQWVPQSLTIEWNAVVQTVVARSVDEMLQYLGIVQNSPDKIKPAPSSDDED